MRTGKVYPETLSSLQNEQHQQQQQQHQQQQRKRGSSSASMLSQSLDGMRIRSDSSSSDVYTSTSGTDAQHSSSSTGGTSHHADHSGTELHDVPTSYLFDELQDWTHCCPEDRLRHVVELGQGRFSVEVPGEPIIWIFCRQSIAEYHAVGALPIPAALGRSRNVPIIAYLVEVQFVLRLETGLSMFAPVPRHLYGELARTQHGTALLKEKNIIRDLLAQANKSLYIYRDIRA
jgi:hypothetical protein